jgi:hypothetical protein
MLALATGYGHSKKHGKGHKGVKGHSGHKGHKGKKFGKKHSDHWAKHSNAKGKHSKGHHDSKKYHGGHHKGNKGHKGAKFGKKGHKHKGHVTKGFKNTYHKNEFSKKTKFYDSFDNGGYHKKFGGYKGHYGGSKGNKFKGGKLSGFFKGGKFGKKHHSDKGKHFDKHKGSKGHYDEKGSYGHKSEHKKAGKGHGKGHKHHGGYGHKHKHGHGHDHGYGHSGHNPIYVSPDHSERREDDGSEGYEYKGDSGNSYDYLPKPDRKKPLNDKKKGDIDQELEEHMDDEVVPETRTFPRQKQNVDENTSQDNTDDDDGNTELETKDYHKGLYPKTNLHKKIGGYFEENNPEISDDIGLEEKSNVDDEMMKQVIQYFQDDKDEFETTSMQPIVREIIPQSSPPIPSPFSPSPLNRIVYNDNDKKVHNNFHPFSVFYYTNKFNNI